MSSGLAVYGWTKGVDLARRELEGPNAYYALLWRGIRQQKPEVGTKMRAALDKVLAAAAELDAVMLEHRAELDAIVESPPFYMADRALDITDTTIGDNGLDPLTQEALHRYVWWLSDDLRDVPDGERLDAIRRLNNFKALRKRFRDLVSLIDPKPDHLSHENLSLVEDVLGYSHRYDGIEFTYCRKTP